MKEPLVAKDEFEEWARHNLIEYASTSKEGRGGLMYRIIFGVFVGGGYKVTYGIDVLYEGGSFAKAAQAFNDAV